MGAHKKVLQTFTLPWLLLLCFLLFTILSWILVFRDPRAIIGIGNLYPDLKTWLFSTQTHLSHYGLNSIPTILFAIISLVAIVAYIRSLAEEISLKKTILFALFFQIIIFSSYPILSTDIFSYIFSERVSTTHHQNIWQVKPAAFPNDQFGVLADWKDTTSVYGGVHYLLYIIPSLLGGNDLLALVILYKVIPALFAVGSLSLCYLLLRSEKKELTAKRLRLVFWNPLFVLEIIGSGHNDSIMIFFMLLGIYLYRKNLWLLSGIILALAVQVKLIPLVLFFFLAATLVRKKAFIPSGLFLAGFLSINALIFSFMQVNLLTFLQRVAYNGGVYWQSLQALSQTFFPIGSKLIFGAFLVWLFFFIFRQWQKKTDPISSYVIVIFVYLLFVSAAYWNWYVLWTLPMLPFVTKRKIFLSLLILTFTSLLAYPLLWVIYRINNHSPLWPVITYLFIFGLPILTYLFTQFREKWMNSLLKRWNLDILIAEKAYF
ncbi:MAG: hypothetical protein ACREHC_04435 [Candidatus Levyibacteriota bacterium]